MRNMRTVVSSTSLVVVALAFVLSGPGLRGQTLSHYRGFALGSDVSTVAQQVSVPVADVKVVHLRPALIQDFQWRTPYFMANSNEPQNDPVQQIAFSFYNDQLFRMVIDYDRQRVAGMTDADMIAALSETYGMASKLKPRASSVVPSQMDVGLGAPIARWGDADFSLVLLRSSIGSGFQVVVTSIRLDALARMADAQAVRLDEREAPLRDIARRKQEVEDTRVSQEKARAANKAAFRP